MMNSPGFNEALTPENRIINSLWIGNRLSLLEMLTLRSFTANGHEFHLWMYDEPAHPLPENVRICDASEILPPGRIFRYRHPNQFGHGKGSVSGFSDIFRYKLLYEKGGWWVDMDITCLKPFDVKAPYFFRSHHELSAVGNIMKAPAGSRLMYDAYIEASRQVNEENRDWHLPIKILNRSIQKHNLQEFIYRTLTNRDWWDDIEIMLRYPVRIPGQWLAIHWMNEEWRNRGIDKNRYNRFSTYHLLLANHGLAPKPGRIGLFFFKMLSRKVNAS